MKFGTSGIPASCEEQNSLKGIECVRALGLDAMELLFVHGCRMQLPIARECGETARKNSVSLGCHASYYLNLLSQEKHKYRNSQKELLQTARVMQEAGGGRITFHPGFYLEMPKEEAYAKMKAALQELLDAVEAEKLDKIRFSAETTGKPTAFGSFEELCQLSEDFGWKKMAITIDWAHVHARDNARIKGRETYEQLLQHLEKKCGKPALRELHCHMSSINFSAKGEINHLTMDHDTPPFKPLAEALKEFGCDGTIISESPNIEKDALYMQKLFNSL